MNKTSYTHSQQGLTLVEIMVALAISALLIAGVLQIFISNKTTARVQENLSRMQENARFALDYITRDIRQAGHLGCTRNIANVNNVLAAQPPYFNPTSGIEGWEYTGTGPTEEVALNAIDVDPASHPFSAFWETSNGNQLSPNGDNILLLPDSDILRIWHTTPAINRVTSFGSTNPSTLTMNAINDLDPGNFILLSDCVAADLMQICDVDNANNILDLQNGAGCNNNAIGNNAGLQLSTINENTEVYRLIGSTYFIRKHNNNAQNPPSLHVAELRSDGRSTMNPQELIQGVENMQVLYGEQANGNDTQYRTANNVTNWSNVTTIKIALLMSSINEVVPEAKGGVYDLNGTNIEISTADRRLRQVYSTTIHLRNRST